MDSSHAVAAHSRPGDATKLAEQDCTADDSHLAGSLTSAFSAFSLFASTCARCTWLLIWDAMSLLLYCCGSSRKRTMPAASSICAKISPASIILQASHHNCICTPVNPTLDLPLLPGLSSSCSGARSHCRAYHSDKPLTAKMLSRITPNSPPQHASPPTRRNWFCSRPMHPQASCKGLRPGWHGQCTEGAGRGIPQEVQLGLLGGGQAGSGGNVMQGEGEVGLGEALDAAHRAALPRQLHQAPVAIL